MKKLVFLIIILVLIYFLFDQFAPKTIQVSIEKDTGIECEDSRVLYESDTHGGFHGDGVAFYILELNKDPVDSQWDTLSPDDLNQVYQVINGYGERFPVIEAGYYYFKDRHSDRIMNSFSDQIFTRYSYNFIFAAYDPEKKRLYYYQLDT